VAKSRRTSSGKSRPSSTAAAKKVVRRKPAQPPAAPKRRKVSRNLPPEEMSLEEWQRELRRQFGRAQDFVLENVGDEPVFSEFHVTNPDSRNTYRVAIRGTEPGENFCSCPDFATNSLGTCKHVEWTLAKLEKKRGGARALRDGFLPPYSEVFLQYGAERIVRFRPGAECPPQLAALAEQFFDDERQLTADAFATFDRFLERAGEIDHELRCYDDTLRFVAERRDARRRAALIAEAFPKGTASKRFETLLAVPLYEYQREGALFAARVGRSLVGDEMGLGKTIQAIAAAEIMAELFGVERVLVVCPTSLKHQWEREIARFANRDVTVVGGRIDERRAQFEAGSFFTITNYDTVHTDLPAIEALAPDLVILDEAQRIKNWNTRAANAVKKIDSPYCVVLTGTPLENRLEELISIVQFVDRHRLGPTYRLLHDHQIRADETGRVVGYRDLDALGRTLEPILLRRRKDEVLDQLPERIEQTVYVPMTDQQQAVHDENREIVGRIVQKWRRHGFLSEVDQRRMRIALQYMRMSCDSTFLCDRKTDHGVKPDELVTLLDELFERPNAKAVVFSQWTRMHELVRRRIVDRDWGHVLFHGGVPSRQRGAIVDEFRREPNCRAMLATDAGGVGLNLQHANVVVNLDLPWNPAILEQRIGRVHRLGQTQPVQVVNFVAEGTIEQGMLSVLAFKKSLFAGVLDGGETSVFLGESRLASFMKTIESVTGEIPEAKPAPAATTEPESTSTESGNAPDAAAASLNGLLQGGLTLLENLAAAARQGANGKKGSRGGNGKGANGDNPFRTQRDPRTGQLLLQFPLPDADLLDRTLTAVGNLLEAVRERR
jgi:hypothetical protein